MRNVSVMFEVSEEVYDNIVTPFKKSKMLGKLMASLLTGYLEDDDIREYIDEEIEGMHKASVDTLNTLFEGMQESLAAMGIFSGEAKSNMERGEKYFRNKAESIHAEKPNASDGVSSEALKEVKEGVDDIRQQMAVLKDLLMSLSKSGIVLSDEEDIKEAEGEPESPAEDNIPSEEEKKEASNIIANILSGNSFTL